MIRSGDVAVCRNLGFRDAGQSRDDTALRIISPVPAVQVLQSDRELLGSTKDDAPSLGCRTKEGWSTDVSLFDDRLQSTALPADLWPKRVEVDVHEVDPWDTDPLELCLILGAVGCQQCRVDLTREGNHPMPQDGRTNELRDVPTGQSLFPKEQSCAAGTEKLEVEAEQFVGELNQPRLLRHGE